ncbi:hypothetical protein PFMALIP_03728 [Plasmodium falciparum MaliPS096_E11]|uniref:EamA domain-containing protein n=1 Tax=Plasmodium falciparum MaliPS096_E11 TaxID=1036727 RepID=A0A024WM08_PLAFA|nr:hypothetical protein PFMALIP_03728 [Plasmodium falciparum MaliPS096_E11]
MKSFIINPRQDEEIRNDIATDSSTVNGININDININDIEENIKDINTDKVKKKDENNSIEYYLFDVESYNNNKKNEENFLDLSSIRSSYLCDNKKKKAKKKKSSYLKKQLKIYKKKYKILPEHNIDQDTNYEESVKNENSKDYKIYELRDIKEDKDTNDYITSKTKDIYDYNNNILTMDKILTSLMLVGVGALTSIFLILAEFSLISYTSSVTLSIVFIGREALILLIGSIFFGEKINLSSSIGIAISMFGTILYGYASK